MQDNLSSNIVLPSRRDAGTTIFPWIAASVGMVLMFSIIAGDSYAQQGKFMLVGLALTTLSTGIQSYFFEKTPVSTTIIYSLISVLGIGQMLFLRLEFLLPTPLKVLVLFLAVIYILIFIGLTAMDMIWAIKPQFGESQHRVKAAIINIVFLMVGAGAFSYVAIYLRHIEAQFGLLFSIVIAVEMFVMIIFIWFRMVTVEHITPAHLSFVFMITFVSIGDFMLPLSQSQDRQQASISFMVYGLAIPAMMYLVASASSKRVVFPNNIGITNRFMNRTSYLMIVTSLVPLLFLASPEIYSTVLNLCISLIIGSLIVVWLWQLLKERDEEYNTQKELEARLRDRDRFDPVSGLTNRVSWMENLLHMLDTEDFGVSVAYIKIVGLTGVSDTHGFKAYDAAIREIAIRLQRSVGVEDDVSLFSNELFSIVFAKKLTEEELYEQLVYILKRVSTAYDIGRGQIVHIRGTAGGVVCQVRESPSVAIQFLDQSIEAAERHGLGHVSVLSTDAKEAITEIDTLVEEVTRAINIGDMTMMFRPIIKLEDSSCTAMEVFPVFSSADITLGVFKENQELLDIMEEPYLTESCAWSVRADCPILVHVFIRERNALSIVDTMAKVITETNVKPENITVLVSGRPADGTTLQAVLNPISVLGVNIAVNLYHSTDISVIELLEFPVTMMIIDFQHLSTVIADNILDDFLQRSIEMTMAMGNFAMISNIHLVDVALDFLDSEAKYGSGDVFGAPIKDTAALNLWRSKTTFSPIEPSSYAL